MKGVLLGVVLSIYLTVPQISAKLSWKCQLVDDEDPGIERGPPKCRQRGSFDRKLGRPDRNEPGYIVDLNQTKYIRDRNHGDETTDMPYRKYQRKSAQNLNDLNRDPGFDHSSKDSDGRPNHPNAPRRPSALLSADEVNRPVDISLDGASMPDFDFGSPDQTLQSDLPICPECDKDIYKLNKHQLLKYYEECRDSFNNANRKKVLGRLETLTEPKMPKIGLSCEDINIENMSEEEEDFYYSECFETKARTSCDDVDLSSLPPKKRRAIEKRCGRKSTTPSPIETTPFVNKTESWPETHKTNCTKMKDIRNSLNSELAPQYLKCLAQKCTRDVSAMNVNGKRKFRDNCVLPGTDLRLTEKCVDKRERIDEMSLAQYVRYENECLIPNPDKPKDREIYVDECENDEDIDLSRLTQRQFREYRQNCLTPIDCGDVTPEQLTKKQRIQYKEVCGTKEVDCRNNANLFKSRSICVIKPQPRNPITIDCDNVDVSKLNNRDLRRYVKYCVDCKTPNSQLDSRTKKLISVECLSSVSYPKAYNVTCDTDINTLSIEERKRFVDQCVDRCVDFGRASDDECISCESVDTDDLTESQLKLYNEKCVEYPECLYHQVTLDVPIDMNLMSKHCLGVDNGVVQTNETIHVEKIPQKSKTCYGVDIDEITDKEFKEYKKNCFSSRKPRLSCEDTDYTKLSEAEFEKYVDDCVETEPTTIELTQNYQLSCKMEESAVKPDMLDIYKRECGKEKKTCENIERKSLGSSELELYDKLCSFRPVTKNTREKTPKLCSRNKERLNPKMAKKYEALCETPQKPTLCDELDISTIPQDLIPVYQSECGVKCFDRNFETMTPREIKVFKKDCWNVTNNVIIGNQTLEVNKKPKIRTCYDRDVDSMTRKEYAKYLNECFDGKRPNSCEDIDYQSLSKEEYEIYVRDCVETHRRNITLTHKRKLTCDMDRRLLNEEELDQLRSCPPPEKIVVKANRVLNPSEIPDDEDEGEKIIRVRNNGTDGEELSQISVRHVRKHREGKPDVIVQEPTEIFKIRKVKQEGGKVLRRIRLAHKKRYHELPVDSEEEEDDDFKTLEIPKTRKVRVRRQRPTTTTTTVAPVIEYYYDYIDEPYTRKVVKHRPGKRVFRKRYIPRDEGHIIEKIDEGYVPEETRYEGYILLTVYPMKFKKPVEEPIEEEVPSDFQRKYRRVRYPGTEEVKKILVRKNRRKIVNRWTSEDKDKFTRKSANSGGERPIRKVLYEVDENGNDVALKIVKENNVTRVQRAEEIVEISDGDENIVGEESKLVEIVDSSEQTDAKRKTRKTKPRPDEKETSSSGEEVDVSQNMTIRTRDGETVEENIRRVQIKKRDDGDDDEKPRRNIPEEVEKSPKKPQDGGFYVVKNARDDDEKPRHPRRKPRVMNVYVIEEDGKKRLIERIETEWTEEEYEEIIIGRKKKRYQLGKNKNEEKKLVEEQEIEEEEWEEIVKLLKRVKKSGQVPLRRMRKHRKPDPEQEQEQEQEQDQEEEEQDSDEYIVSRKRKVYRKNKEGVRELVREEVLDGDDDQSVVRVGADGKKHLVRRDDSRNGEGDKQTIVENRKHLLPKDIPVEEEKDVYKLKEHTKGVSIDGDKRKNNSGVDEEEDQEDESVETVTRIIPGKKRTYRKNPDGTRTLINEEERENRETEGSGETEVRRYPRRKRTYRKNPDGTRTLINEKEGENQETEGSAETVTRIIPGKKRTYRKNPDGTRTLINEEERDNQETEGSGQTEVKRYPGKTRKYRKNPDGTRTLINEKEGENQEIDGSGETDVRRYPKRKRTYRKNPDGTRTLINEENAQENQLASRRQNENRQKPTRNQNSDGKQQQDQEENDVETRTRIIPGKTRTYRKNPDGTRTLIKEEEGGDGNTENGDLQRQNNQLNSVDQDQENVETGFKRGPRRTRKLKLADDGKTQLIKEDNLPADETTNRRPNLSNRKVSNDQDLELENGNKKRRRVLNQDENLAQTGKKRRLNGNQQENLQKHPQNNESVELNDTKKSGKNLGENGKGQQQKEKKKKAKPGPNDPFQPDEDLQRAD